MLSKTDLVKLNTELQKPVYAGKQDWEIQDMFSVGGTTDHWCDIEVKVLMEKVMEIGLYRKIKAKRGSDSEADLLLDMLQNARLGNMINLGTPVNRGMLASRKAKGDINGPQQLVLANLGKRKLRVEEELLGVDKTIHHLDVARALGRGV